MRFPTLKFGAVFGIFLSLNNLVVPDQSTQPIVAKLYLENSEISLGTSFKVKIELENTGDHTILIGRELSQISNYPFRIKLSLQNEKGDEFFESGGGFIDSPPLADFCADNGLLKWWAPLGPHAYWGT